VKKAKSVSKNNLNPTWIKPQGNTFTLFRLKTFLMKLKRSPASITG